MLPLFIAFGLLTQLDSFWVCFDDEDPGPQVPCPPGLAQIVCYIPGGCVCVELEYISIDKLAYILQRFGVQYVWSHPDARHLPATVRRGRCIIDTNPDG